jgi:predicted DNA-binding transcriptional regulator AlpA
MSQKQKDIQFLEAYQKKLIKAYDSFWQLLPCDLIEPPTRREIINQLCDYAKSASIRAENVKSQIRAGHLRKCAELLANPVFRSEHADLVISRNKKVDERRQAEREKVAMLVDEYGEDCYLFLGVIPPDYPLSLQEGRKIHKQIEILAKVIAKMRNPKPVDKSAIPKDAALLTVSQLAKMLQISESEIRKKNNKGLIPAPIPISGNLLWSRTEITDWIAAGGLPRHEWEKLKKQEQEV